MKVLIAEDDRVHAHLLAHQLKAQHIQSIVAYDAMQAIMLASRNEPDAVLLDINMPGGTGLEVLKRLKASMKTSMIPIITFSGGTDPGLPQAVRDLGAEEFLQKPVPFDKLFALLCGLLHLAAPAGCSGAGEKELNMNTTVAQEPLTTKEPITVFAVDDDPVTRRMLKAIFERNGYVIETAGTAEEALQGLSLRKPGLIILDVVMPGISGFELCKKIKENEQLRRVPVLFLTGQSQPKDYKEGHDCGAMMYVPKPVKEESLLRVAQMFLPRNAG